MNILWQQYSKQLHAVLLVGNLEEAERLLGKALKAFPDSTRVRLSYAELFELRVRLWLLIHLVGQLSARVWT